MYGNELESNHLPSEAAEWLSLIDADTLMDDLDVNDVVILPTMAFGEEEFAMLSAIGANDEYLMSFVQIADCLRWTYLSEDA